MRLPKRYFDNLSAAKYREYLKLLPDMKQGNNRMFVTLSLTFGALIFFGIFAINPTLTTIADLEKQLAETTAVEEQLRAKITNLSSLQQQYNQLEPDLKFVFDAIPKAANAPLLSAQINALAQRHNITITTYRIAEVQLTSANATKNQTRSYVFNLQATGNYEGMMAFSSSLASLSRIVTVESMSIGRDTRTNDLILTLRGRQYFKP